MEIRHESELEVMEGVKHAYLQIKATTSEKIGDQSKDTCMLAFKHKEKWHESMLHDMIWYKTNGKVEWEDVSDLIMKHVQGMKQEERFKTMTEEHKKKVDKLRF